ncbi:hypothetical protein KQX54_009971 [Cotesia glomerata]|uniref:Uncharacterized protein n=1 Tax=Cotesia glomerata TaxID=32391 RepID=A0AAV7J2D1_COTGL|nr:hypothetical protein KQX54_009971 [Cotesia glomerata]
METLFGIEEHPAVRRHDLIRKERTAQDLTLTVGYVMLPLTFRVIPDSELHCRKTRKRDSKEGSALLFFLALNSV